jgi:hypothetical protein
MKMTHRRSLIAATIAAALLAACGGSGSSEGATATTTARVKNAALPTTTVATATTVAGATTVAPATTAATATTVAATTTVAAAPTTTIAVPSQTKVSDPGNFAPTYLAPNNALGSPRPVLPAEASVTGNAARTVSTTYRTDASGTLTVASAEWVGTTTPMTLRWNLTVGSKTVPCDNCAFVSTGVKKAIKAVLAAKLDGSGITSVRGYDPAAVGVGSFLGNGWGAEFVVGDPTNVDAAATGNSMRDLVLGCTGATASTCFNVTSGIAELRWKNQVWSTADCVSALQNGGPKLSVADLSSKLKGANADTTALIRQRASLDRVAIALPQYRPVFATTGTARALTGFASTGCAQ